MFRQINLQLPFFVYNSDWETNSHRQLTFVISFEKCIYEMYVVQSISELTLHISVQYTTAAFDWNSEHNVYSLKIEENTKGSVTRLLLVHLDYCSGGTTLADLQRTNNMTYAIPK